jgi:hypothetical protein
MPQHVNMPDECMYTLNRTFHHKLCKRVTLVSQLTELGLAKYRAHERVLLHDGATSDFVLYNLATLTRPDCVPERHGNVN